MVNIKMSLAIRANSASIQTGYNGAALTKRASFIAGQVRIQAQTRGNGQATVLDLGCGLGTIPFLLGSKGYTVTAVDLDAATIAACQQKNGFPHVKFVTGNAENIDLGQKFDVVIASEVIEHVPHPGLLMETISRHLAKDGIAIISIPNGYCLWETVVSRFVQKGRLVSWLYKSPRLHKALTGSETPFYSKNVLCFHAHFFSFGRLEKLLAEHGFKISSVRHSDLGVLPEWWWLRALKRVECRLADYVPHSLAGGWLLVIRR